MNLRSLRHFRAPPEPEILTHALACKRLKIGLWSLVLAGCASLLLLTPSRLLAGGELNLTNAIIEMRMGSNDLALIPAKMRDDTNIIREIEAAKAGTTNHVPRAGGRPLSEYEESDLIRAIGELRLGTFEVVAVSLKVLPLYYAARVQVHADSGNFLVYLVKVNNQRWRVVAKRRFVV